MTNEKRDLEKLINNSRSKIIKEVSNFVNLKEGSKNFIPGLTYVQYSGAYYGKEESKAFINSFLDGWFGLGSKGEEFENKLAETIGTGYGVLTNSGSSASLLSIATLSSWKMNDKKLKYGDEIIVAANSFPTTVNPIIQFGLIPVFLDPDLGTYNVSLNKVKEAITDKTRAVYFAHTLGNPYHLEDLQNICQENNLFLIEDNCDALGSKFNGKMTGSFGDLATHSFYPAHHLTCGEGGAVLMKSNKIQRIVKTLRDWGRGCYCSGSDQKPFGECGSRFEHKLNDIPYDHKYIFDDIGFNLKPLEFQAAMLLVQLERLGEFMEKRKNNFKKLDDAFKKYEDVFILPKSEKLAEPSWFAYPVTLKTDKFSRNKIITYFEEKKIQTRVQFSGNLTAHPAYKNVNYKIHGKLDNANKILKDCFFLGIYPGITDEMMDYVVKTLDNYMSGIKNV
jgi:CDP-6-deoxy-D-xylo-4-hexulose-3-dehydrase